MQIKPDEPFTDCPEVQLNVKLASPLNETLESLVSLANAQGARTIRKEMVGALVYSAPRAGPDLLGMLLTYRAATARDAALDPKDLKRVLNYQRYPRGPRTRRRTVRRAASPQP
jgi:hypothetical protein